MGKLIIILTLFYFVITVFISDSVESTDSQSYAKVWGSNYVPTLPPRTTTRALTCACDNNEQKTICASNGISYSDCRFQCAKRKVPRLRAVKSGACNGMTKQQYWNSGKNSRQRKSVFNTIKK